MSMALFSYEKHRKKKENSISLMEIAMSMFKGNQELIDCLSAYLQGRKKERAMPTSKSWTVQLNLLKNLPDSRRIYQVKRATERGWRAVAFEETSPTVSRNKFNGVVVNEAF